MAWKGDCTMSFSPRSWIVKKSDVNLFISNYAVTSRGKMLVDVSLRLRLGGYSRSILLTRYDTQKNIILLLKGEDKAFLL